MIIYIDIIFIENIIMNTIILYATAIILKQKVKNIRLIISAVIGSIYSILMYITKLTIYSSIISKFILSVVMAYVAFKPNDIKKIFKQIIIFYLTSFVFGGAALGVIYMVNTGKISIKNGAIIGNYTLKTILTGFVIAFLIIITAFKFVKSKISKNDLFCNIIVKINKKEVKAKAMIDTGNMLKEPITNIPVVVMEHSLLYDAIPKEILENIDDILGGDFNKIPEKIKQEYMSKLKVIPFSSLGKQNGMLLGLKADELEVEAEDGIKNVDKVIIGIYNKNFSKKGE